MARGLGCAQSYYSGGAVRFALYYYAVVLRFVTVKIVFSCKTACFFQKSVGPAFFLRNETDLVGITIDGGVLLGLHVGVNRAPLIVLCRRLWFCYGKNRLFMQKNVVFPKKRRPCTFFRNETVLVGITTSGGVW